MICTSSLLQLLASVLWVLSIFVESTQQNASEIRFAEWGKPCKRLTNKKGEVPIMPRIDQTCDLSKGVACQEYSQGDYCGCLQQGTLTYDRQSKECRIMVGQYCHPIDPSSDTFKNMPFNVKCHVNAECKQHELPNKQKSSPICSCKPGYIASADLIQCNDPNSANSSRIANSVLCGLALLFTLIFKELF